MSKESKQLAIFIVAALIVFSFGVFLGHTLGYSKCQLEVMQKIGYIPK